MGLFSLTDINFNVGARNLKGQKESVSLLGNNTFDYNITRYPIDIGDYDKGHYMIIYINQQRSTNFPGRLSSDNPQIVTDRLNTGIPGLNSFLGKIDVNVSNSLQKGVESLNNFLGTNIRVDTNYIQKLQNNLSSPGFIRTIQRTNEALALYMPDTLNFTHNQSYAELSLGGGLSAAALASASSLADTIKKNAGNNAAISAEAFRNLSPIFASLVAQKGGDLGRVFFTSAFGAVQNPMMEILYSSPAFRSFRFEFMFYPRSQKEAKSVQDILDKLYFHQAPEILQGSGGFLLVPPSEFDIKFYYNGKENPNIPKISTCVLEQIDVDYAPNGFSAYEVPNNLSPSIGATGMPVAIRLSLQFKETAIITKEYYRGGVSTPAVSTAIPESTNQKTGTVTIESVDGNLDVYTEPED